MAMSLDRIDTRARRDEETLSLVRFDRLSLVFDRQASFGDCQAMEGKGRRVSDIFAQQLDRENSKVMAGSEQRPVVAVVVFDMADRAGADGRFKTEHVKRFFEMKRALVSVFVHAAVVVKPVGQVGILLDLGDQDALSDGVEGTWFASERRVSFSAASFTSSRVTGRLKP